MENKLTGLVKEPTELDKIIWGKENHQIAKLYKLLLERNMEQEVIKENMIKWMQELVRTIQTEDWFRAWTDNPKLLISTVLKENYSI